MSESPEAMRKRNIAAVRPLSDCAKTNERSGMPGPPHPAPPPGWGRGRERRKPLVHEPGRVDVGDGLHDREGILGILRRLAVELPAVRLVILLANGELAGGRVHGETEERLRHLLAVRGPGLLDGLDQELHPDV